LRGIGTNSNEEFIEGHLDRLGQEVARAQQAGFDGYELSVPACNAIQCGRLIQKEMDGVRDVLARYPLAYTLHAPCELRLTDRPDMGQRVFESCLEMARQIGAEVMVYHSAQIALRPADQETGPLPDADGLREMWRRETAGLKEMARRAEDKGVMIGVENRDPHLWELAALARHGKPPSDFVTYHQGMRLDLLADQVAEVASPNVGICLDVGHAFLAVPYWQQGDFLTAVRQCAPLIRHVHFHDNFGRLDDLAESVEERLIFGEADSHLPPGWGVIPLAETLAILKEARYTGWITCETRPRYVPYLAEVAATLRKMVGVVRGQ